jgi:hypothetical protein
MQLALEAYTICATSNRLSIQPPAESQHMAVGMVSVIVGMVFCLEEICLCHY